MDNVEISDLFDALTKITEKQDSCLSDCCDNKNNYIQLDKIIVCKICNSIISNLNNAAEWKYYSNGDSKSVDPNRCGMPVNSLLPNSSIGSTVSNCYSNNKDIYKVKRFQEWNSMSYKERSRYKIFNEIKDVCEKNGIPLIIIKESNSLYTLASDKHITRGNKRKGLIASCVYFACKNCKAPRSKNEIAKIFSLNPKLVTIGVKILQDTLQLTRNGGRLEKYNTINQNDFIERFCYQLKIEDYHVKKILELSNKTLKNNIISENTPPSIATGCIYYYSTENKLNICKKDICDICDISEVTINKCYLKIKNHINNK